MKYRGCEVRPMKYPERIAKCVVEACMPGSKMEYRSQQPHGEHDFDLHYADGTSAAVEVTESADQLQKLISAKIRSKKEGGWVVEARTCKRSWMIFPMRGAIIGKIRKEVDARLSVLEQEGIDHFNSLEAFNSRLNREAGIEKFLPSPVPRCVEDICYDLLIQSGSATPVGTPPKISIQHPVYGGAVGSSVAIDAAEQEANKEDNRRKLGAANTPERHLVVYVDVTNGLPWASLTDFEPTLALPKIPQEITHIWLIGHSGEADKNEFVVWRGSTTEPWHSQRVVIPQNERKAS